MARFESTIPTNRRTGRFQLAASRTVKVGKLLAPNSSVAFRSAFPTELRMLRLFPLALWAQVIKTGVIIAPELRVVLCLALLHQLHLLISQVISAFPLSFEVAWYAQPDKITVRIIKSQPVWIYMMDVKPPCIASLVLFLRQATICAFPLLSREDSLPCYLPIRSAPSEIPSPPRWIIRTRYFLAVLSLSAIPGTVIELMDVGGNLFKRFAAAAAHYRLASSLIVIGTAMPSVPTSFRTESSWCSRTMDSRQVRHDLEYGAAIHTSRVHCIMIPEVA